MRWPGRGPDPPAMPADLLVLGAGVSGLTCAALLLERGHRVRIRARELPPRTTSAVAAALWYPFEAGPPEKIERWALRSLERFRALARDPGTGVVERECLDLRSPALEPPSWLSALQPRSLERRDLAPGFEQGWFLRVPVIEMPRYLPWLEARVRGLGGAIEHGAVESLDEVHGYDAVVNCTGLGSAALCAHPECFPIRGQVVRVPRSGVERSLVFQRAGGAFGYVIPRSQDCVLGGTAERGAHSLAVDAEATERILARCRELEPALDPTPLGVAVGLRPGRSAVRLELDRLPGGTPLVHDYGHGGCGVTLSWACAEDVLALVEEALS